MLISLKFKFFKFLKKKDCSEIDVQIVISKVRRHFCNNAVLFYLLDKLVKRVADLSRRVAVHKYTLPILTHPLVGL